jgi:hypothetical protein
MATSPAMLLPMRGCAPGELRPASDIEGALRGTQGVAEDSASDI